VTGMRIIRAILGGEHEPSKLAALREPGCKASEQTFIDALIGNYRHEHLFALRQAVELFDVYQSKIAECDRQIAAALQALQSTAAQGPVQRPGTGKRRRKNQPHFDAWTLLYRMTGVDLTAIDGLQASSVLTILSETGTDMSPWKSSDNFASWLALTPNHRITGGKPIRKKGRTICPNRAAQAFHLAAQTLERARCGLGAFFRKKKALWGRPYAIKATAHKLAVIFYSMLKHKTEYRRTGADSYEQRSRDTMVKSLKKKAATLGFILTPIQEVH
jgi:transposase